MAIPKSDGGSPWDDMVSSDYFKHDSSLFTAPDKPGTYTVAVPSLTDPMWGAAPTTPRKEYGIQKVYASRKYHRATLEKINASNSVQFLENMKKEFARTLAEEILKSGMVKITTEANPSTGATTFQCELSVVEPRAK
jgi:hypothetical protein